MRNVADFKLSRRIWILSLFLISSVAAWAQAGHVKGYVTDSQGRGIAGVTVWLIDSYGNEYSVKTGDDGSYSITNLEPGTYKLGTDLIDGYSFSDPADGNYSVQIRAGETIVRNFTWRGGVVIDFGDPPTNGGGTRPKVYLDGRQQNLVPVTVRIQGVAKRQIDHPQSIEILGQFSLKGDVDATIDITQVTLAAAYSFGSVRFENLGANRFALKLQSSGWPGFVYDGELAVLYLKVRATQADAGALEIQTERIRLLAPAGEQQLPNRIKQFSER